MESIEPDTDNKHQSRIKQVDVDFIDHENTVVAHDVLDDAEDGPDHNESAGYIEHDEKLLPRQVQLEACSSGLTVDSTVENDDGDDEDAKEDELDPETNNDNHLSLVAVCGRFCA